MCRAVKSCCKFRFGMNLVRPINHSLLGRECVSSNWWPKLSIVRGQLDSPPKVPVPPAVLAPKVHRTGCAVVVRALVKC